MRNTHGPTTARNFSPIGQPITLEFALLAPFGMDAKLKTLKIVDLKKLLSEAHVSVPSKAKKDDLIVAVLANPAALEVYSKQVNDGEGSKAESAPEPTAVLAPEIVQTEEKEPPTPAPVLGKRARDAAHGEDTEMKLRTPPPAPMAAVDATDDDDDVGPMPMPAEVAANGSVKKKRKGAYVFNFYSI